MPSETGDLLGSFVQREMLEAVKKFGLNRSRIKIIQTPNPEKGTHTFAVKFDSQHYGLGGTQTIRGAEFPPITLPGGGNINQSGQSLAIVINWFNELKPKIAAKAREFAEERNLEKPGIVHKANSIKVTFQRRE